MVRGLEPKVKIILPTNVAIGRHVEQTDAIEVFYSRVTDVEVTDAETEVTDAETFNVDYLIKQFNA